LRPGDTLARLGGDEFAVVVGTVHNRSEVLEIAHRLDHSFENPFAVGGHVIRGSASIGIAIYPEDADSADSLLKTADSAMYAVKQSRHGSRTAATGAAA
jgi:diguanylate cyclase (GGDEF)-like protein